VVSGAPITSREQVQVKNTWQKLSNIIDLGIGHHYDVPEDVIKKMKKKRKQKEYKLTKKDWIELLNFWPMTIVVPIMLILILFGPWIMS
jgi:hypothetical protein